MIARIVFAAFLMAPLLSPLNACPSHMTMMADEQLDDATAQRVLGATAPLLGVSAATLGSAYQAGTATITDLGPIRGGHRYGVTYGTEFVIVDEMNL